MVMITGGASRQMMMIVIVFIINVVYSIPIDNGIEGSPEIECGANFVSVNFNTQRQFDGHVYVRGRYDEPGCRSDEGGRRVAGMILPFNVCGVSRQRSLNPRGVFIATNVIVTFHPQFITKVDRSYRIQCFYMEADKTVSSELDVSDLTTALRTPLLPMPICRYEILDGGPSGEPIRFAIVGAQVYHKWTCDSETIDTFCMRVHSCYVDDGNGDQVSIIDADGCALDRYLLNNLEYPEDLIAGQEAHVFKYADRSQLVFECQIEISVRRGDATEQCKRPVCTEPPVATIRGRRGVIDGLLPSIEVGTVDVRSSHLTTIDIDIDDDNQMIITDRHRIYCIRPSSIVLLLITQLIIAISIFIICRHLRAVVYRI